MGLLGMVTAKDSAGEAAPDHVNAKEAHKRAFVTSIIL